MRLKLISCEMFAREVIVAMRRSVNAVDARFLPGPLHRMGCLLMRQRIQDVIDSLGPCQYQAVLLAHGLCSHGVAGLRARTIPLVIPRRGSRSTFWQADKKDYPYRCYRRAEGSGQDSVASEPIDGLRRYRQDFAERDGAVRRNELKPFIRPEHHSHGAPTHGLKRTRQGFRRSAVPGGRLSMTEDLESQARQEAEWFGWDFERTPRDLPLIQRFLDGYWSHHEFLVVPPGWTVGVKAGEGIVATEEAIA